MHSPCFAAISSKLVEEVLRTLSMSLASEAQAPLWRSRVSDNTDGPLDMWGEAEGKESTIKFGWNLSSPFYLTGIYLTSKVR